MTTTIAESRELVREFTAALNAAEFGTLEGFFATEYDELHDNEESIADRLQEERERHEAFTDKHEAIDGILVDPDREDGVGLNVWYTVTGTHAGEFLELPPTGTRVEFPLLRTFVVEDGHVERYRVVYTLGFLLDLGLDWEQLTAAVDMEEYLTTPTEAGSARAD